MNVWLVQESGEQSLSQQYPNKEDTARPVPQLLHSLLVHTLNFCSFASIDARDSSNLFIAVPGVSDGSIVLWSLPWETLIGTVPPVEGDKTGMVMTLSLLYYQDRLTIVAGHETGWVAVYSQQDDQTWRRIRKCDPLPGQEPKQPILSLDVLSPDPTTIFYSGADNGINAEKLDQSSAHRKTTGHSGQQSLRIRSDHRIFATAGWDGRGRVYSAQNISDIKELAVLKYHSDGCYALDFAEAFAKEADTASSKQVLKRPSPAEQRAQRIKHTHWLALGSKDGRVSLWDVF